MSRLLRLYPRAWRERYGAELASIVDARPLTLGDRFDLIRGALDAHVHPELVAHAPAPSQPIPLGHRLPGLLAIVGGLMWAGAFIAAGITGNDSWLQTIGVAFLAMMISLPGAYVSQIAARVGIGIATLVVAFAIGLALPWEAKAVPFLAILVLVGGGTLALATIRAGLGASERRMVVLLGFGLPAAALTAIVMGVGTIQVDQGRIPQAFIVAAYGLTWAAVGVVMLLRGTPTFPARAATTRVPS